MKILLKTIIIILIIIPLFFGGIILFTNSEIKYIEKIEIDQSVYIVDEFFSDIQNMKKYMPGTKEIILTGGEDGEVGAEYKIVWEMGKESIEMKAFLQQSNLPDSITYIYTATGVVNTMTQKHKKINDQKTLIINEQEFQFHGIMKILTFLNINGFKIEDFKKQSQLYLKNFKEVIQEETQNVTNV